MEVMKSNSRNHGERLKRALKSLYRGWIRLGEGIALVVTAVILFIFYFVVLSSVSLVARLFSPDPLEMRWRKVPTYWNEKRDFDTSPARLRRWF